MRVEKIVRQAVFLTGMIILIFVFSALGADQKELIRTELPQPDIPQPQFFCGYCHILTYPGIVSKGYETWKKDKHVKYGCVECHYPPRENSASKQSTPTDTPGNNKHIPAKPPERFSYTSLGGETVRTRPIIPDASCMTLNCHGKPDDKFKTKKIQFTEKIPFVHKAHLEKKNQIQGQKVNCTTCHQHETEKKHFEVSKESCYLCHFKNTKFDEGRSKCILCHKLPEKPIQTSGEKPITHKMLQDAKVQCGGCHFELVKGGGEIRYELAMEDGAIRDALIMGGGQIKKAACSGCHDREKHLKETENKKLMHEYHVAKKNARCFDCHKPIRHKKTGVVDPIRNECSSCHPDHHKFQKLLIRGFKREGISETPDSMYVARANCLACHAEHGIGKKGESTLKASGKTCVSCHSKDHAKMLKGWIEEVSNEVKAAKELENEAMETITDLTGKAPAEKLAKAREMLKQGQDNLRIVEYGNGVHNRKYAMMLLDAAMNNFEDLVEDLEDGD